MPLKKKYNIVLLTIDALRYDHCGFNGYHRPVTPRLDTIMKRGVIWDHMFSTAPYTPPAFCSMFTATYPFDKGGFSPLPLSKTTVAEIFQEIGYKTGGFTSNPLTSHYYNYERGFSKFFDSLQTESSNPLTRKLLSKNSIGGSGWNVALNKLQNLQVSKLVQATLKRAFYRIFFGRQLIYYVRARWITRRAIKWVKNRCIAGSGKQEADDSPFFLWIHYMDTHDPFIPKWRNLRRIGSTISKREFEHNKTFPEYTEILKEHRKRRKLVDFYDAEIRAVDDRIGFLVEFLVYKGLYDNTIFIITADHGEEFDDHGDFGHRAHLYDELIRVPFGIFGGPVERGEVPGLTPGMRVNGLASLIQLAPTMLDLAGILSPSTFNAASMLATMDTGLDHVSSYALHKGITTRFVTTADKTISKMACVRDTSFKFIHDEETGKSELYNLRDDPKEARNVVDKHPTIATGYRERCLQYLNGTGYPVMTGMPAGNDERTRITSALHKLKGRF